jgi:RHS repeat-associated protein
MENLGTITDNHIKYIMKRLFLFALLLAINLSTYSQVTFKRAENINFNNYGGIHLKPIDFYKNGFWEFISLTDGYYYRLINNSYVAIDSCHFVPSGYSNELTFLDYDNDNDFDFIYNYWTCGQYTCGYVTKMFTNNGLKNYTELTSIGFPVWDQEKFILNADLNNDNNIDILICSYNRAEYYDPEPRVYVNQGFGDFSQTILFPDQDHNWWEGKGILSIDFNNDGKVDIIKNGYMFKGNGDGSFTLIPTTFNNGDAYNANFDSPSKCDYDKDGDFDVIAGGKLYRNDGYGVFTDISLQIGGGYYCFWVDINSDGYSDILSRSNDKIFFLINDGKGNFNSLLTDLPFSNYFPIDIDNDGDIDLIKNEYTGGGTGYDFDNTVYLNQLFTDQFVKNTLPTTPTNLQNTVNGYNVTLSWQRGSDAETPRSMLTYNMRMGKTSKGVSDVSPLANHTTGQRRVIEKGNCDNDTTWTIYNLPEGKHYWSVQTIDNFYSGSPFATEQIFNIPLYTPQSLSDTVKSSTSVKLCWVDSSKIETNYIVERSTDNGQTFSVIATISANSNTYTDNTASPGTNYIYRVKCISADNQSPYSNVVYVITPNGLPTFSDCFDQNNCGVYDSITWVAINYLFQNNIVQGQSASAVNPTGAIFREDLAKILFKSLFGAGAGVTTPADNFPTPYNDLQTTGDYGTYHRYARVLCYLEFNNGVSVFDRNFFNFRPGGTLQRLSFLKALLESWNILPNVNAQRYHFNGTNWSYVPKQTDVPTSNPLYGYFRQAWALGLLDIHDTNATFRPYDVCTREEAFVMLYKLLTNTNTQSLKPSQVQLQNIANYFVPGNYTPATLGQMKGMEQGNFSHYTKTSFSIPDVKLPLNFEHFYNSFSTELPDFYYPQTPLGKGWGHSYNSYILFDDNAIDGDRYIVYWANSDIHVFNPIANEYVTLGVYDQFSVSGNTITITKKTQVQFIFQKLNIGANALNLFLLTSVIDRNNNTLQINYEDGVDLIFTNYHDTIRHPMKRVVDVTAPSGRKLNFYYVAGTNLIDRVTDPLNRSIYFTYTNGVLTGFKDAKNQTTTYGYASLTDLRYTSLLTTITLPKGNKIINTYYNRKLTSTKIDGLPATQVSINNGGNFNYNDDNSFSKTKITDTQGKAYDYNLSKNGLVSSVVGQNLSYQFSYPTTGRNLTKPSNTNMNGVTINYEYDNNGNVTLISKPMGISESFTYNATNDVLSYTDALGNTYNMSYDGNGNLISATDPLGATSTMNYNSQGLITSMSSSAGLTISYDYNNFGNITSVTKPLSGTLTLEYDNASRVTSVTNNGKTTSYEYDANDNMLKESNPENFEINYQYDANDNLLKLINEKGIATTFVYDNYDRKISETFGSATKQYTYNNDGSLATFTKPGGESLGFSYDASGRLISNGYISNTIYDGRNNTIYISNANGGIYYEYDLLNRVVSTTDYYNNTVNYKYDKVGNVIEITYPGDKKVTYGYDALNRMTTVTDWDNKTVSYTYDSDGKLITTELPNNITSSHNYDSAGRLTNLSHKRGDNSVIASYVYQFDANNNITSETVVEPVYNYPAPQVGYTEFIYSNVNRLQYDGSKVYYTNANGNNTGIGTSTFGYDLMDNLTTVNSSNFIAEYQYDAFGDRRLAKRNGKTTRYVLNALGMSNVLMETDSVGNPLNYYVYGIGLVSRISPSGSHRYYHQDFRGSIIAMTDSSAMVTHKYGYDAWGNVIESQETNFNPFRYIGLFGVMFEDSTLQFMRARYYNPHTGRFYSEDPIWSTNLYTYSNNNPVNSADPSGLKAASSILKLLINASKGKIGEAVVNSAFDSQDENVPGNTLYQKAGYSLAKSAISASSEKLSYAMDMTEKLAQGKDVKVAAAEVIVDKLKDHITYGAIKAMSWCPPFKALDNEAGRALVKNSADVVGQKVGGYMDQSAAWFLDKTGVTSYVTQNKSSIRKFFGLE